MHKFCVMVRFCCYSLLLLLNRTNNVLQCVLHSLLKNTHKVQLQRKKRNRKNVKIDPQTMKTYQLALRMLQENRSIALV